MPKVPEVEITSDNFCTNTTMDVMRGNSLATPKPEKAKMVMITDIHVDVKNGFPDMELAV